MHEDPGYIQVKIKLCRRLVCLTSICNQRICKTNSLRGYLRILNFVKLNITQGGHGTGKTGNLAVNFSRQGKHREFSKFNFLHRENCANTGKFLKI